MHETTTAEPIIVAPRTDLQTIGTERPGGMMVERLRVGLIYGDGELSQSITEQQLGARLAAAHTRANAGSDMDGLELIERPVSAIGEIDSVAGELTRAAGCQVLLGAVNVPVSIAIAKWAETN